MRRNTRGEVDGGALVAIVLLIIALLGAFYLLFMRGGGDEDVEIRVDLPDTIGLAPPSALPLGILASEADTRRGGLAPRTSAINVDQLETGAGSSSPMS